METKLYFDAIYGNKTLNTFMHACDLSDRGHKEFALPRRITLTTEDEITEELVQKTTKGLVESLSDQGFSVVFVGFRSLTIHSVYVKHGIQTISDGSKWSLFEHLLNYLNYDCETTDHREVTTAKFGKNINIHV